MIEPAGRFLGGIKLTARFQARQRADQVIHFKCLGAGRDGLDQFPVAAGLLQDQALVVGGGDGDARDVSRVDIDQLAFFGFVRRRIVFVVAGFPEISASDDNKSSTRRKAVVRKFMMLRPVTCVGNGFESSVVTRASRPCKVLFPDLKIPYSTILEDLYIVRTGGTPVSQVIFNNGL